MLLHNLKDPLITICCLTYNHEKYIAEAINSFLMQKTSFEIEIIIHDDASTDKTQEIIKSLAGNDLRFNLMLRKENIKSKGGMVSPILFNEAKGKYIAMCDGDDFWTDPYKLQKQVDLLERNKNVACSHNVRIINQENQFIGNYPIMKEYPHVIKDEVSFKDILTRDIYLHTSSYLFNKKYFKNFPQQFINKIFGGDRVLLLHLSSQSNISYIDEEMSIYRRHESSMTSVDTNLMYKKIFEQDKMIYKYYDKKYKVEFYKNIITIISKIISSGNYFHKIYYRFHLFYFRFKLRLSK
jgi:glycosyltransferase involved in cell wall biosynthesis